MLVKDIYPIRLSFPDNVPTVFHGKTTFCRHCSGDEAIY